MISATVVNLAIEYLDQCKAAGRQATLVGMHWYIDGRNKTMPLTDEINEALNLRPEMFVSRDKAGVVFSAQGTERAVTNEDMRRADERYRAEFSAELRRLTSGF